MMEFRSLNEATKIQGVNKNGRNTKKTWSFRKLFSSGPQCLLSALSKRLTKEITALMFFAFVLYALFTTISAFDWNTSNSLLYKKTDLIFEMWFPFAADDVKALRLTGEFPWLPDKERTRDTKGELSQMSSRCNALRIKGIFQPPETGYYIFNLVTNNYTKDMELWLSDDYIGSNPSIVSLHQNGKLEQRFSQTITSKTLRKRYLTKGKGYAFQIITINKGKTFKLPKLLFKQDNGSISEFLDSKYLMFNYREFFYLQFSGPPAFTKVEERHRKMISLISRLDIVGDKNALIPKCNFTSPGMIFKNIVKSDIKSSANSFVEIFHSQNIIAESALSQQIYNSLKNLITHYVTTKIIWRYKMVSVIEITEIALSKFGPVYFVEVELDVDGVEYNQLLSLYIVETSSNPLSICSHLDLTWKQETLVSYSIVYKNKLNNHFVNLVLQTIQQFSNIFEYYIDINFEISLNGLLEPKIFGLIMDAISLSTLPKSHIHIDEHEKARLPSTVNDTENKIEVVMKPGCELPININDLVRKHTYREKTCLIGYALQRKINMTTCQYKFTWESVPAFVSFYKGDVYNPDGIYFLHTSMDDIIKALEKQKIWCIKRNIQHLYCSV